MIRWHTRSASSDENRKVERSGGAFSCKSRPVAASLTSISPVSDFVMKVRGCMAGRGLGASDCIFTIISPRGNFE